MRCLWLTWIDPVPEHDGQRIYSGRLMRSLARQGVKIDVLCAASPKSARRDGEFGEGIAWHLVQERFPPAWTSVSSTLPHIAHRSATPAMRARLLELLAKHDWDCVVFDGLSTGWALPAVRRALNGNRRCRLVYVSHNHEASTRALVAGGGRRKSIRSAVLQCDAYKIERLERRMVRVSDLITAITPEDALLYSEQAGDKPLLVLSPGYEGRRVPAREITSEVPRRAILVGSFDWIAKQMNLREFVAAADPVFAAAGAELDVVGHGDPSFFEELRGGLGATRLVGPVESVTPYLDAARIAVVPERLGGGFKLKVLEYIFNRLPVAALEGSVAGTPLSPDTSMLAFSSHQDLANGVLSALDDLALLNRLQTTAYNACSRSFDWDDRGARLAAAIAA